MQHDDLTEVVFCCASGYAEDPQVFFVVVDLDFPSRMFYRNMMAAPQCSDIIAK